MSLQFLKAGTADAVSLMCISKKAFDSDVEVGAKGAGGPPGYATLSFHTKMARMNCLYKLVDDYKIVGGALLFLIIRSLDMWKFGAMEILFIMKNGGIQNELFKHK